MLSSEVGGSFPNEVGDLTLGKQVPQCRVVHVGWYLPLLRLLWLPG